MGLSRFCVFLDIIGARVALSLYLLFITIVSRSHSLLDHHDASAWVAKGRHDQSIPLPSCRNGIVGDGWQRLGLLVAS